MNIKTFALVFDLAMLCYYTDGMNCNPMETCIQETIDKYCTENDAVECDRKITTILCEGNARLSIVITSKFKSKSEI